VPRFASEAPGSTVRSCRSGLAGPFMVQEGPVIYQWSPCTPVPTACNGQTGFMAVALSAASPQTCWSSFGTNAQTTVSLLGSKSQGVQVKYQGGNNCQANPNAVSASVFDVLCASSGTESPGRVQVLSNPGDCTFHVQFQTTAGCPIALSIGEVLPPAALVVIVLAGLFVLYMGGGAVYNITVRGASGAEAIPHIDAWRACFGRLRACCSCSGGSKPSTGFYSEVDDGLTGV
jgi:hypothetical protein